jgi:transcriptional regulator with XRE-family HTH domain
MDQVRNITTVAETVASNVRAFRQLRGMDQAALARRMEALGIEWRQGTVSEVERNQRNVTVAELLALAFALGTTIEQLVDPRGPERIRGPWLSFSEEGFGSANPNPGTDQQGDGFIDAFPPQYVTGLVCTHADYPIVEWGDDGKVKSFGFGKAQPR